MEVRAIRIRREKLCTIYRNVIVHKHLRICRDRGAFPERKKYEEKKGKVTLANLEYLKIDQLVI